MDWLSAVFYWLMGSIRLLRACCFAECDFPLKRFRSEEPDSPPQMIRRKISPEHVIYALCGLALTGVGLMLAGKQLHNTAMILAGRWMVMPLIAAFAVILLVI